MKREYFSLIIASIAFFLLGMAVETNRTGKYDKLKDQSELIELQSDSIRTLENRLQASNEKRGRLFLALLYTDIPGKKKELDSLLLEIGKDN